ncbi:MAG: glycosyltransferase family 2 protein [Clostridia bacterium]|nr:glycosyltransferase family 2 protein [Clostridia bacterium]
MTTKPENGQMPLISVIVPAYKVEKYLHRCVDSILAQSYPNIEVLLVDDGSPDRCPQICDEYARQDARVRAIHKPNGGLSDARNAGMDSARGEYIAFVDGDDYVDAEMYATLCQALEKSEDKLAICGFKKVTDEGVLKKKTDMRFAPRLTEDEYWYQLFFPFRDLGTVAWNKLYHRSLLEGLRFPVGAIHEDEWLVHQYVSRAEHITVVNRCLYYYVVREGSITAQTLSPRSLSIFEALSQRLAYFAKAGKKRAVVLSMRNYAHYVARFLSDWKRAPQYAEHVSKIKAAFRQEIRRYGEYAGVVDRMYWKITLYAPGLLQRLIRFKEERKRRPAQAQTAEND